MSLDLQPRLEKGNILLAPLQETDFEPLYQVASDPAVWAQHPNKDRWQRPVFQTFFDGALQSGGAFTVVDKTTGAVMGSSRFYDYRPEDRSIYIGYTFYGVAYWGKGINPAVKALMLDHAFPYVDRVCFHIGASNIRSQIAIGRIGAVKVGEQEVTYYGELPKLNFVYQLLKADWGKIRPV